MRTEVKTIKGQDVLMVEVPDEGVASGVGALWLDVDQALDLFGRLSGLLPTLSAAAPELRRHTFIRDDGEPEESWACPRCDHVTRFQGVIEFDSHQAHNDGDLDGDNLYIGQVDTERATMAFLCAHCRKVVSIPGEVEVTWS